MRPSGVRRPASGVRVIHHRAGSGNAEAPGSARNAGVRRAHLAGVAGDPLGKFGRRRYCSGPALGRPGSIGTYWLEPHDPAEDVASAPVAGLVRASALVPPTAHRARGARGSRQRPKDGWCECENHCVADPELLVYEPVDDAIVEAARLACLTAVQRGCAERGVEAPSWAHLAELGLSSVEDAPGEYWLRFAAGDTTSWYILTGALDHDDIVMTAAAFGEMLANDVLPDEK